jgi:glycolate oxidase iron-sulfur subunit
MSGDSASPFSAFDQLKPLIDACVHCGFCLPACPSYLLLNQEMDSPRGRVYLLRAGLERRTAMTDHLVRHFDTCLGCLSCVTACPSGVQYGPLIEAARAGIEAHHPRRAADRLYRRLLFAVLPYPERLRLVARGLVLVRPLRPLLERLFRRVSPRLAALVALAPAWPVPLARAPDFTPARATPRLRVALLTGCVQRVFFGDVNRATARVLSEEGCEVFAPPRQPCCGALALHSGLEEQARDRARETILVFERLAVDRVVVNAAGCGSTLKAYGRLLAGDPAWAARAERFAATVNDVTEILSELAPPRAPRHALPLRVVYQDACHLAHGQGIRRQPRELLAGIPGLDVIPMAEEDICCGSAGLYNLLEPELASALGDRKVRQIAAARPDVVASANPGCLLQLAASARRAGMGWPLVHPIELVDASQTGVGAATLLRRHTRR